MKKLILIIAVVLCSCVENTEFSLTDYTFVINTKSVSQPYVKEYNFEKNDTISKKFICNIDAETFMYIQNIDVKRTNSQCTIIEYKKCTVLKCL